MNNAICKVPVPYNEPTYDYAPGSHERAALKAELELQSNQGVVKIPVVIGGKEIFEGPKGYCRMPHKHSHILAEYTIASPEQLKQAVEASMQAREMWYCMPWNQRVAIFLKAADLLAGKYRYKLNAATMLGQSKTAHQAEIDAACELIDFLRYNVAYVQEIYEHQPNSSPTVWNRMEHRPLSGFVLAVSPFNFTAIGGNLPVCPAIMGNTVLWKPASSAVYSNYIFYKIMLEAGLPAGVINFVPSRGSDVSQNVVSDPRLAGFHFTGSTEVFSSVWRQIGENIAGYDNYPRIVGETGGKDFIFAHPSADVDVLVTALVRGAYEFSGQKCSAASRAYIPQSIWPEVKTKIVSEISNIKMGDVRDFRNFMGAVIDENSFKSIAEYIDHAKASEDAEVLCGGYDDSVGYFVEPTLIVAKKPDFKTMCEEIFGPVLTVYIYPDNDMDGAVHSCNTATPYALTGSVIAQDRQAIAHLEKALYDAAGNFYINDKPTGAVIGQQPFGGGRASGTNDKAGSVFNLLRWTSARSIKETLLPAVSVPYPFMGEE